VDIDGFLLDSFTTAIGEGEMAVAVHFPAPGELTAGAYQKLERKVGDYATAAAAVQISLDVEGKVARAGIALSAAGPCAVRVEEAEQLLEGQAPTNDVIRAAADAASRRSAPQGDLRGSVEYKKNLAGVLVARGLRQALGRLGVQV
jgi:carbon-monoxide dehydrogenase medium subunit